MIKFDHDFVGRKALEKEVANPRRKMVTLLWNTEDVMDVHASQFQTGRALRPHGSAERLTRSRAPIPPSTQTRC